MKAICDRTALVESLNLVAGVVVARTPKPVLTCVKLTAEGSLLTLAATDLEVYLRVNTPRIEISEEGGALILADKLSQIVRESVDPTLTLESEGDATHIRGQDSHFKVFGYPLGEFPAPPEFDGNADFEVSAGSLTQQVLQTVFASARENSRYAMNGVLVEREGNKLNLVATDGHRLAVSRGDCKAAKGDSRTAIIPTKALTLLSRLLNDPDQTVKVKIADNQAMFVTDNAMLSTKLVEGNFPPYKDVIPRDNDKKATLDTQVLTSAVRRAALLTNEESKGVRFAFKDQSLNLSSRAPEMGEAQIEVPMPKYQGDAVEIGFNPAYVLDALKVVDANEVQIDLKAPNKPGILRTGNHFVYVVMPVNLQ
ncbi:MAG: DNA polymerase III subunit beta [Phycisphaera sp.]|nr:DNA polymerase III subunit beta [Phycisphaera sp.]